MKVKSLLCLMLVMLAGCQADVPPNNFTIAHNWSYPAGDYVRSKAMVINGVVYLGADDNALHAVDANTGQALWRYETADNVTSTPAVYEDLVYFGSWDGTINAVAIGGGEPRWQNQTDGWVTASPVITGGTLYVGSHDNYIYALDAGDGDLVWQYETGGHSDEPSMCQTSYGVCRARPRGQKGSPQSGRPPADVHAAAPWQRGFWSCRRSWTRDRPFLAGPHPCRRHVPTALLR